MAPGSAHGQTPPSAIGDTRAPLPTAQELTQRAVDELTKGAYDAARTTALVAIAVALSEPDPEPEVIP